MLKWQREEYIASNAAQGVTDRLQPIIDKQAAEIQRMRTALERLAKLGNGETYGNSDGNCIAIAALQESE